MFVCFTSSQRAAPPHHSREAFCLLNCHWALVLGTRWDRSYLPETQLLRNRA